MWHRRVRPCFEGWQQLQLQGEQSWLQLEASLEEVAVAQV